MEPACDKGAYEVEREHKHPVRQAGVQQARGVGQAKVGGNAGVGEDVHVFAPAEFGAQQVHARAGSAVGKVTHVMVADEGVEAADGEVAAGDDDGRTGGAPIASGYARGKPAQARQPPGRQRFAHGRRQGERHAVAAVAAETGVISRARRPARSAATVACASPNGVRQSHASIPAGSWSAGIFRRLPVRDFR